MQRLIFAISVAILSIPMLTRDGSAQQTVNTIPQYTTPLPATINSSLTQAPSGTDITVGKSGATANLFVSGPVPVIDVTALGAVGDGKTNNTATTTANSPTLTIATGSAPQFSSSDQTHAISVNGAGVPPPTSMPGGTVSTGGGLTCGSTVTAYWQITFVSENATTTNVTSESTPSSQNSTPVNPTGCTGSNARLTITGPANPLNGATGWLPYVSYGSGTELVQALAGNCMLSTQRSACAFGNNWSSGGTSTSQLLFDTAPPPVSSVLLTTIASVGPGSLTITLSDNALQAVSGNGSIAWGTDNSSAISTAFGDCPLATNNGAANTGCILYFPGPTAPNKGGRYFVAHGIATTANNVSLVGGGSFGSGDAFGYGMQTVFAQSSASAQIVGSGRFPLITVGGIASQTSGFNIINLGFADVSGSNPSITMTPLAVGNMWGGVRLRDVLHAHIERLNAANFGNGYGIEIEGDATTSGGESQIGTVLDSNCSVCRIGVWGPQQTSDILIQGGTYSGSGEPVSYGIDFESAPGGKVTDTIRVMGSAVRNHVVAGVRFFDCGACQVVALRGEQVKETGGAGTGILVDGTTTSNCRQTVIVGGSFSDYTTDVNVTANCQQPVIVAPPSANVLDDAALPLELSGSNMTPNVNAPYLQRANTRRNTLLEANLAPSPGGPLTSQGDFFLLTDVMLGTIVPDDNDPAMAALSTGTTSGTTTGLFGIPLHRTGRAHGMRVQAFTKNEATSSVRFWIVMTDQTLAHMAISDIPSGNYAGFLQSTTSSVPGDIACVLNTGSTQNIVDSGVSFGASAGHRFELFEETAVTPTVWHFYIDGAEMCGSGISTDEPAAHTNLRFVAGGQNLSTAAINFDFAWAAIDEDM